MTHRAVVVVGTQVKWATSDKLSKKVALKIISKKKAPMDFQQKFLPRELDVMKMLDHPHIIKLYDILYINDKVTLGERIDSIITVELPLNIKRIDAFM